MVCTCSWARLKRSCALSMSVINKEAWQIAWHLVKKTRWSLKFFRKQIAEQAATIVKRFIKRHNQNLCPSHSKLLLLFLKLIFFTCSGLQACSLLWFQHVCSCSVYFRLNNWLQPASVCNRLLTSSRKNASRNSHATTSKNEGTQYLTSFRTAKLTM